jgi:hypothetical protein
VSNIITLNGQASVRSLQRKLLIDFSRFSDKIDYVSWCALAKLVNYGVLLDFSKEKHWQILIVCIANYNPVLILKSTTYKSSTLRMKFDIFQVTCSHTVQ